MADNDAQFAESGSHAGCMSAWEYERNRRQHLEARLAAINAELRLLAHAMDGISGHVTHERLGGKTLGGAVRNVADAITHPRVPSSGGQS